MADSSQYTVPIPSKGFCMQFTKHVRRDDWIKITEDLTSLWNSYFSTRIRIEVANPAALVFLPGQTSSIIKLIRFHFKQSKQSSFYEGDLWSLSSKISKWKNDDAIVIPKAYYADTALKFYEGHAWTLEELRIVQSVLTKFGIICYKFPSKKSLER